MFQILVCAERKNPWTLSTNLTACNNIVFRY